MSINDGVSYMSWSPDSVVPQLCLPTRSQTVLLKPSTTFPKGSLIAERSDTPGIFDLYVNAGANGTGTPKGIIPRAYVTDASGNVFPGSQAADEIAGIYGLTVPAWTGGAFKQSDIPSFVAADLTALRSTYPGAAVVSGTVAAGNAIIQF